MKRTALLTITLLCLGTSAQAQPADEPHFGAPAPRPVPDQIVDIDDSGSSHRSTRAGVRRVARRSSGVELALNVDAGYTYYFYGLLDEEKLHGPVYGGTLTLTWDTSPSRVGLMLRGFYAPSVQGTAEPFLSSQFPGAGHLWGISAGVFARYSGFWGSASLGAVHVGDIDEVMDPSEWNRGSAPEHVQSYTIPELALALGYDLSLGRHLALRVGGEVGSCFLLSWRFSANAGVVVRF